MEPTTVAMVFWLMFAGGFTVPIPYDDKGQCEAAGKAQANAGFSCIQQPVTDIEKYGSTFDGKYAYGIYDQLGEE